MNRLSDAESTHLASLVTTGNFFNEQELASLIQQMRDESLENQVAVFNKLPRPVGTGEYLPRTDTSALEYLANEIAKKLVPQILKATADNEALVLANIRTALSAPWNKYIKVHVLSQLKDAENRSFVLRLLTKI
jgi:hypothetical protein